MHSAHAQILIRTLVSLIPAALLAACGTGDGQPRVEGTPQPTLTGVLIDSPVAGVTWKTSGGKSGLTNELGEFQYTELDSGTFVDLVTFSIGDIVLGTVRGAPYITAVELTNSFVPTDRAATNLLVFLQSIDADSDPSNGITISEATRAAAVGLTLDFDAPDFDAQVAAVVAAIAPGNAVVSDTAALDQFYATYAALGGTDTFGFGFPGYPPVGEGAAEFELVFADEFDVGDAPNPEFWNIDQGYGPNNAGWGNNEWQLYTDLPDNLRVADGNLVITALCPVKPCGVRDGTITSARITTVDKFEFKYGKVVARIKPPVGQGTWPAFWSLGANFPDIGWPRSGEIDFMELFNNTYNTPEQSAIAERTATSAMHWCDETIVTDPQRPCFPAGRIFVTQKLELGESLANDFHIWEADWTADRVVVSIDGIQYFELEIDPATMEEFRREFFLLLNVATGGTLGSGGEPPQGDEPFPQTMLVDYVRVYQQVDDIAPPELTAVTIASSNAAPRFASTGDVVTVTLTADEPIVAPRVTIGGITATDTAGSGASWQASRAITPDDTDGVIPFSIEYADLAGNAGVTVTTSTDGSRVTVDATAPSLPVVTIASSNANPGIATLGDTVEVTLNADEPIGTPVVTIGGVPASDVVGSGANWRASRAITADDADGVIPFSIGYADLAGNAGVPVSESTDSSSVNVNKTAPTVAIEGAPASFVSLEPIPVVFQFSKPVTGFDLTDIQAINGAAGAFVAVDADTYSAVVTPTGLGDLVIGVPAGAARDAAGNPSQAAADVIVANALDPNAPLLSFIGISSSNANPAYARTGDVVTIAMTATEAITEPTVTIAGAPAAVTGSGNTWQASRTALDTDPEGPIAFVIDNFQAVDDGTPGYASTVATDGSAVIFDVTPPTLSIEGLPATIAFLEPLTVTFRFDEAVSGFELGDIDVTNGALSGTLAPGPADTYTLDVTPDGGGDLTVAVAADAATDAAGNGNAGASASSVVGSAWRPVWSDDFEVDGVLDAASWTVRTDADCPDPCAGVQSYVNDGTAVTVADGLLKIQARDEGGFKSGLVDTRGKRKLRFGRVELDARLPGTQGTRPSLWLLPVPVLPAVVPEYGNYGPWPQSGEIDVVNAPNLGPSNSTLEHTLRYGLPEPEDTATTKTSTAPTQPTLSFLTYAIEWEGGEIRWFVNDVHVATQTQQNWYAYFEDADGDGAYDADGAFTLGAGAAPFDEDFYLVIGLAVGSDADAFFPQTLEIDAVRVYECANPADPAAGTGCSTGTGVPPEAAPAAPSVEALEIYTDAPAVLDFLQPDGVTTLPAALVPATFADDGSAVVTSNIAATDGNDIYWNVNAQTGSSAGGVYMGTGTSARYIDLTGGETAGELLFRMRVNSATAGTQLAIGLEDRGAGSGRDPLSFVADGTWRNYSVKLADLIADSILQNSSLDIAELARVFVLEVRGGTVNLDVDDIELKVACRDAGDCEATPRGEPVPATVVYAENFESLDAADPSALGFSGAGFGVFADVWIGPVGTGTFLYQYGVFSAPNGGPGFSSIANNGEGGPEQGVQYLNVYSDYNNQDHANGYTINTSVLRDLRNVNNPITAEDIGLCWTFTGDYKAPFQGGIAEPASNATGNAFIVTLDPSANFAATNVDRFDTTAASNTQWASFRVDVDTADPLLIGQVLQIGFNTTATNFDDSGVYYDNLEVTTRPGACPPDPGP